MTTILFILAIPSIISLGALLYTLFISNTSISESRWVCFQILISYDQWINTLFQGWADETISSRCYRMSEKDPRFMTAMKLINALFTQPDHCKDSWQSERDRLQLPPELRG